MKEEALFTGNPMAIGCYRIIDTGRISIIQISYPSNQRYFPNAFLDLCCHERVVAVKEIDRDQASRGR
jgi:hypothetical protein